MPYQLKSALNIMLKPKLILLTLVALLTTSIASSQEINSLHDSLTNELEKAKIPEEQIKILYDLFDISLRRDEMQSTGFKIYDIAHKTNNVPVQIDILKQLANLYLRNDSILVEIRSRIMALPESDDQKEALAFVNIRRVLSQLWYADEYTRQMRLSKIIKNYSDNKPTDIYEQIERVFSMLIFLGFDTNNELTSQNIVKLKILIDKLPERHYALRNMLYTMAAIMYTQNENPEKAVEVERKLLNIMSSLSKKYKQEGRKYRNFADSYYNSYRRLLSNYPALTLDEVNHYYAQILRMAEESPRIKLNLEIDPRPKAYYLLAHERYDEAIPMLKKIKEDPRNSTLRLPLLKAIRHAAAQIGDSATIRNSAMEYCDLLENYIKLNAADHYKELQILYDLENLRSKNNNLEIEKRETEIEFHRNWIITGIGAIILLLAILLIVYKSYVKTKSLTLKLESSNEMLRKERDNLEKAKKELVKSADLAINAEQQKNDFINNISHEIKQPLDAIVEYSQLIVDNTRNGNKHLDNFASMVSLNSDLLMTLVNDILDTSMLENGKMTINVRPASVNQICTMAINSTAKLVNKNVTLKYLNENDPDRPIFTDQQRVEQVLLNLISNAAKFTSEGSITLEYDINTLKHELRFIVTDTGIGIPKGKEETIFKRFEKLDPYAQGTGLGLHISRLIAQLLGGSIRLDTTYHSGARFIFTIPTDRRNSSL